jgi:cyclase
MDAVAWAVRAAELGAGELNVTSVDREGTGRGFDLELVRSIAESVGIPVIAHGGAGTPAHVREMFAQGSADAVALASLLHYDALRSIDWRPEDFAGEGNIEFIKKSAAAGPSRIQATSIERIKATVAEGGIDVRAA